MSTVLSYIEEDFGILTDDDLYLDCTLIKPKNMKDGDLRVLRAWVPKFPLTKTSVITCARQEVRSYGSDGKIAHLVFDLRGTGSSDGTSGDHNFQLDLHAIKEWAKERFGRINFSFLGSPISKEGQVNLWPLRPGSVLESYYYKPSNGSLNPATVLYLSTYSNFSRADDILCAGLAQAGYHVYGLDPLRYLLHASATRRLKPGYLWEDLQILVQMLPSEPIIVSQPLASGLGIMWTSGVQKVRGLIAIGRAQPGLSPKHIFQNNNPYEFLLSRYIADISGRPFTLVMHKESSLGGNEDEINGLFQASKEPHRLERVRKVTLDHLLTLLSWTVEKSTFDLL